MCRESFMKRALELAQKGLGQVEPNPAVGCVIVKADEIIGEGFHEYFGGAHAEVNALEDCRLRGSDPAGADVYVTLEPCCHTGKTGPCSQALIRAGVRRVFCAGEDPTKKVRGKGNQQLREAGIEVHTGCCREEAESLNAPFYKHARTGLPWVILKWAQSLDGKLARRDTSEGRWISNEQSRREVHQTRKKVQAVLTGIQTVLADNPMLTVRLDDTPPGRPPLRVVLDSRLQMPWDSHLINVHEAPTLLMTTEHMLQSEPDKIGRFIEAGVEVLAVPEKDRRCDLPAVLETLGQRDIQQVLIEAGPTLLTEFLRQDLADELHVYIAPLLLGRSGSADLAQCLGALPEIALRSPQTRCLGSDLLVTGRLH